MTITSPTRSTENTLSLFNIDHSPNPSTQRSSRERTLAIDDSEKQEKHEKHGIVISPGREKLNKARRELNRRGSLILRHAWEDLVPKRGNALPIISVSDILVCDSHDRDRQGEFPRFVPSISVLQTGGTIEIYEPSIPGVFSTWAFVMVIDSVW